MKTSEIMENYVARNGRMPSSAEEYLAAGYHAAMRQCRERMVTEAHGGGWFASLLYGRLAARFGAFTLQCQSVAPKEKQK